MQLSAAVDFHRLFESVPGLYLILLPDLTIVAVSDAYLKATMTERSNILGHNLFHIFPDNPDDPAATGVSNLRASLNYVLRNGEAHTMAVQQYDIRRPDGTFEERFWSPLNKPVFNEEQKVAYIIHRVEDVTEFMRVKKEQARREKLTEELKGKLQEMEMEVFKRAQEIQEVNSRLLKEIEERKTAEEELKRSNELFSNLFELNPASLSISRLRDRRVLAVNSSFLTIFGFISKEEVIGKTADEVNIGFDVEKRDELYQRLKEWKKVLNAEGIVKTALGESKWISTSILLIEIDNEPCTLAVSIDITGRKKAEEKVELVNKELEAFSYSVSHDLRSPLRIIDGYSEIMISDYSASLDAEGNRLISIIKANVRKMGRLIDDLLNFSRLGRKELTIQAVDMNKLVESIRVELLISVKKEYDIKIGVLGSAYCDSNLIRQVWVNLFSNAIKYSGEKDKPAIEIKSVRSGNEIVYSVQDNGVGFSMQYADKLFGVFQRLHKVTEFEGTGVGLALVHRIISRHGGRVWAEAELNKGATFYFSLPLYPTH